MDKDKQYRDNNNTQQWENERKNQLAQSYYKKVCLYANINWLLWGLNYGNIKPLTKKKKKGDIITIIIIRITSCTCSCLWVCESKRIECPAWPASEELFEAENSLKLGFVMARTFPLLRLQLKCPYLLSHSSLPKSYCNVLMLYFVPVFFHFPCNPVDVVLVIVIAAPNERTKTKENIKIYDHHFVDFRFFFLLQLFFLVSSMFFPIQFDIISLYKYIFMLFFHSTSISSLVSSSLHKTTS